MTVRIESAQGTTVIIIEKAGDLKTKKGNVFPATETPSQIVESPVSPLLIRNSFQEFKDRGVEEFMTSIPLTRLEEAMISAQKQNKSYEDFSSSLELILEEMLPNIEGKKMGTLPTIVSDFRKIVLDRALDIWTDPSAA